MNREEIARSLRLRPTHQKSKPGSRGRVSRVRKGWLVSRVSRRERKADREAIEEEVARAEEDGE